MSKPTYLGLLNAIAVGEQRGYELLTTWAGVTQNAAVRETLNFVAAREREHAAAFAKRMCELGFGVREKEDTGFAKRLKKAASKRSDQKKFEKVLGYGGSSQADGFSKLFDDPTIDPQTGALLGRFIAEERDSGRRLRACYESLTCGEDAAAPDEDPLLQELADRLDRLSNTLGDLKALQKMPRAQSL